MFVFKFIQGNIGISIVTKRVEAVQYTSGLLRKLHSGKRFEYFKGYKVSTLFRKCASNMNY